VKTPAPQKHGTYVPGSSDLNDPSSDNFDKIRADTDAQYGKGTYDTLVNGISSGNIIQDPKTGDFAIQDKNGKTVKTISSSDALTILQRTNNARTAAGQQPVYPGGFGKPVGANPESNQAAGTDANPFKINSPMEGRSLPTGSISVLPDGTRIRRNAPNSQDKQQATAPAKTTSAEPAVTGGDGTQVAEVEPGDTGTTGELAGAEPGDTGEESSGEGEPANQSADQLASTPNAVQTATNANAVADAREAALRQQLLLRSQANQGGGTLFPQQDLYT
jgi:hypothetical protein